MICFQEGIAMTLSRAAQILLFCFLLVLTGGCETMILQPDGQEETRPEGEFRLPTAPSRPPEAAGDVRLASLFYPDDRQRFLVPVKRAIPYTDGIARVTLGHLVASPDSDSLLRALGLAAPLPGGTEILGLAVNDEVARVEFNAAFLQYPASNERLVLGSILCTLRQFSTIQQVEIIVEGEQLDRFPGGTPGRMPLGPECWINLELDSDVDDYRNFTAVKLYFCYPSPNGWILYVPVTRILRPEEDAALAAVGELLEGPRQGSGLFSDIPVKTALLSLAVSDGLAIVDLSEEVLAYSGGLTGAENLVTQILLTLSANAGVELIQILVEGEKVTLPDGLDLTEPLTPPGAYNYF
jgi:germination protein M